MRFFRYSVHKLVPVPDGLCPKKENISAENLRNEFKSLSVHLHLDL